MKVLSCAMRLCNICVYKLAKEILYELETPTIWCGRGIGMRNIVMLERACWETRTRTYRKHKTVLKHIIYHKLLGNAQHFEVIWNLECYVQDAFVSIWLYVKFYVYFVYVVYIYICLYWVAVISYLSRRSMLRLCIKEYCVCVYTEHYATFNVKKFAYII